MEVHIDLALGLMYRVEVGSISDVSDVFGSFIPIMVSRKFFVRFEVFTAVVMKSIIFWDVTPRSLLSCNRRFGGTYCLHLQGRRNNLAKTIK
jgi:hypothetical protein